MTYAENRIGVAWKRQMGDRVVKETFLEIWTGIPTWAKTLAVVAAIGFLTFFFSIDKGQYIPDNPAEEAVEAVIQITTGADVDLTPESEEKGWRWFS